jgi:hypothetical protein
LPRFRERNLPAGDDVVAVTLPATGWPADRYGPEIALILPFGLPLSGLPMSFAIIGAGRHRRSWEETRLQFRGRIEPPPQVPTTSRTQRHSRRRHGRDAMANLEWRECVERAVLTVQTEFRSRSPFRLRRRRD